jgi:flagellar basal body rod protein FlgG
MLQGYYSAATDMRAALQHQDILAQKLAHAPVPVYRRQALSFENYLAPTDAPNGPTVIADAVVGQPIQTTAGQQGPGLIRQGFLEGSNIDVLAGLVNLSLARRAYEFNSKAIPTTGLMPSFTTNLIR